MNSYSLRLEVEGAWFAAVTCMKRRFVLQEVYNVQDRTSIQQDCILSVSFNEMNAQQWPRAKVTLKFCLGYPSGFFLNFLKNISGSQSWLNIKVKSHFIMSYYIRVLKEWFLTFWS